MVRNMNLPGVEDLKAYEASIADAIRTFAHDNGPEIRRLFDVSPEGDVLYVAYCSLFGHTLDVIFRTIGREKVLDMARKVMDNVETVNATLAEGAKRGLALDPYAVAADVVTSEPS